MSMLVRIAEKVINRPLMIHPDKLLVIASVLDGRIGIDASEWRAREVSLGEADAIMGTGPDASQFVGSNLAADGKTRKSYRVQNGTAIIPVFGSLVNRGAWLGSKSGMTSYEGIAHQLDAAAKDSDVHSILLDMDSPGGEAVGAFEIADKVRSVANSKNVTAMVNGMAASAAYAIASAANRIVSTPSGVSGSIGVVLMHADYSNALHQQGVKPTMIHAGAHKVDGNPYEPLSESVKADLKAEVDQFYSLFVSGVAKGRGGRMTEQSIRGTEARTYIGEAALKAGLVDAIGSFETVLADLSKRGTVRGHSNPTRISMSDEKTFSQAELDAAVNAAVTSARTEATAAAEKAKADSEDTIIKATAAGAKAERERISGIVNSEEAKGRSETAMHFAMSTDLTVDVAKGALAGVARALAGVSLARSSHGLFIEPGADVDAAGAKGDHGWGDVVAHLNKQHAR